MCSISRRLLKCKVSIEPSSKLPYALREQSCYYRCMPTDAHIPRTRVRLAMLSERRISAYLSSCLTIVSMCLRSASNMPHNRLNNVPQSGRLQLRNESK